MQEATRWKSAHAPQGTNRLEPRMILNRHFHRQTDESSRRRMIVDADSILRSPFESRLGGRLVPEGDRFRDLSRDPRLILLTHGGGYKSLCDLNRSGSCLKNRALVSTSIYQISATAEPSASC
jgi:hypothetical protein